MATKAAQLLKGKKLRCYTCLYLDNHTCRKRPPKVFADNYGVQRSRWPRVNKDRDWCGEWQEGFTNEEK